MEGNLLKVINGITVKGKLGQWFCKHKNKQWYKKQEMFQSLAGDTSYQICKDCGKEIDTMFIRHD